jgi:hypothetical protein
MLALVKADLRPIRSSITVKLIDTNVQKDIFSTFMKKLDTGLIKRYRIMGGHCRQCSKRADCLSESAKSRARFVYRSSHQHEIDKVRARQEIRAFIAR